jgi:sorbitol/mannitol transport system permease protein
MLLTGFKEEARVVPPSLIFQPTLQNYADVLGSSALLYLFNSLIVSASTVIVSTALAVPAAYAFVFGKLKDPGGSFFWFVTTLLLPPVSVVVPVYIIINKLGLLDSRLGLVVLYLGSGIPLMIWMVTMFFRDIPVDIVEASYVDGSGRTRTFFKIMLPLVRIGIGSAAMIVFLTVWNEFFFAVTVTYIRAITFPVYMSKFMAQEGFFWGKMCASGTIIIVIPAILGFLTQKTFVKGLTVGAVNE